jgi:hypothetical protein
MVATHLSSKIRNEAFPDVVKLVAGSTELFLTEVCPRQIKNFSAYIIRDAIMNALWAKEIFSDEDLF